MDSNKAKERKQNSQNRQWLPILLGRGGEP
jgi:hypothetical protein